MTAFRADVIPVQPYDIRPLASIEQNFAIAPSTNKA
jgi:hypothetical protein